MHALGRLFDIGTAFVPSDVVAAAATGKLIYVGDCEGVVFVCQHAAGSTDIIDFDVQECDTSGGSPRDLDVVTEYFYKSETTLDNDETWTRGTQSAASEVTNVGAASEQLLAVIQIESTQLSDGYKYISVNVPDAGTNGTLYASGIYIKYGLKYPRKPANLPAPLR